MRINLLFVLVMVVGAPGVFGVAGAEKTSENSAATWGRHEPFKGCVPLCHDKKPDADSTDMPYLVSPVPQLCYTCHKEYAATDDWKHGPVATGECLLCHEQHQAENNDDKLGASSPQRRGYRLYGRLRLCQFLLLFARVIYRFVHG